jgi:hypothetical protein
MFTYDIDVQFEAGIGELIQDVASFDNLTYAPFPREDISERSGVSLMMQLLDSIAYRTKEFCKVSDVVLNDVFTKASSADEIRLGKKIDYPTLFSIVQTCIDQNIVAHAKPVWTNNLADLAHYVVAFGNAIVELKATSTTLNAHKLEIESTGEVLSETITKGFLLWKIDGDYAILQNTLGVNSGFCGFNKISTSLLKELLVKGMTLAFDKESV